MSKNSYRHVLETYLHDKKTQGETLPGIRGHVNYKGIAIETGIPYCHFAKGSELRSLVDASLGEVGVANGSRSRQPRRALEFEVNAASMTYGDLKEGGLRWLQEHNYAERSVASYMSHLNAFMRHWGRTDEDPVIEDFGTDFDSHLHGFLKATGRGKAVASALRLWSKIEHELHRSTATPTSFPATLTALMQGSRRTIADVARAIGLNHSTLWDWMSGDHTPTDPRRIAKLEKALNVPAGTLSFKLTFYKIFRATNIPKEWWPATWQKYYSNYRHHRNRVIDLIPEPLLSGPLEELKPAFDEAVQKVLEGVGEPAYRRRSIKLTKKAYRLPLEDWPDHAKAEFAELTAYKRSPGSFGNKNRGRPWAEGTLPIVQEYLESFFGFLRMPADDPDPELRGMGVQPTSLTLAWLAVQDVVAQFLEFRRLRSGAHNGVTESFVRTLTAQLQPDSGWLWLHPELLERLPAQQRGLVEATGGWRVHCAAVFTDLKDSLATLRRNGEIKRTRKTMLPIGPILEHPEPLRLVNQALVRNRWDLEARMVPNQRLSWKLAAGWRDHVLISFLARLPLRSKHWGLLTYKEDGSGYLQNHPRDGWRLVIPYDDFKNVRNTTIFTVHSQERVLVLKFSNLRPLEQLVPLLDFYLAVIRPVIAGEGDFLFPTRGGKAMSKDLIYRQVSKWTREYMSQHSPRKLGIDGVFPFGPHAFRDIVATHVIKTTGSIALAANILLDSEEMVRQHYARFLPEDRVGLAMAGLAAAFETDEDF